MKLKRMSLHQVDVNKASVYCILINLLQILAGVLLAAFILLDTNNTLTLFNEVLVLLLTGIACFGAVMDIREAMTARRMHVKMQGLNETVDQMSELNVALRSQRHDFLNHLQVVYSLMEMEEYKDACAYIEQVYGDIRALSISLRTGNAPVNALLRAKMAECRQGGVTLKVEVEGMWKELPLPGWEMCRVLSNLIDNARDALQSSDPGKEKYIRVRLTKICVSSVFWWKTTAPAFRKILCASCLSPASARRAKAGAWDCILPGKRCGRRAVT